MKSALLVALGTLMGAVGWDDHQDDAREAYAAGQFDQSEAAFKRALKAARSDDERAVTTSDLGTLHIAMKRFDDAMRELNEALALATKLKDRKLEATVLDSLGLLHKTRGDFKSATASYDKATPVWESLGDKAHLATNLNNKAVAQMYAVDAAGAYPNVERAVALWSSLDPDHPGIPAALMTLGSLDAHLGRFEKAEKTILDAIARMKRGPPSGRQQVGRAQVLLGDVYAAHEKHEAAHKAWSDGAAQLTKDLGANHPWTQEAAAKVKASAGKQGTTPRQPSSAGR